MNPMEIIEKYWNKGPPIDIWGILSEIDNLDFRFVTLPKEMAGFIQLAGKGLWTIGINIDHSKERRRFTAAHELGHYYFHRGYLGDGVSDSLDYRPLAYKLPNKRITIAHERQATSFAANVLMPHHLLTDVTPLDDIPKLASQLEVSEAALRIRLGLNVLPEVLR
jgi:Zn-dependent peptidase ImmA (M78 family)